MSGPDVDEQLSTFLEIRKPGAHLEEDVVPDDFVLMLGVDLVNYPKFPKVDDGVTYPRDALDIRQELDVDSGAELPDYSGPYRADLRFTDFSAEVLATKVAAVERGVHAALRRRVGRRGGRALRRRDDGRDRVGRVERPDRARARAHAGRVPARRASTYDDPNQRVPEAERAHTRVVYTGLFSPGPPPRADQGAARHLVARQPRVPAAVHRGVGRADRRALRARRDVRHPVHAVGRHRAARRASSSRPSTSASPATPSRTG